jgi:hypothetical protein
MADPEYIDGHTEHLDLKEEDTEQDQEPADEGGAYDG